MRVIVRGAFFVCVCSVFDFFHLTGLSSFISYQLYTPSFIRLQDQPGPGSFYEDVSAIFKIPDGGTLYIGNVRAAASKDTLAKVTLAVR